MEKIYHCVYSIPSLNVPETEYTIICDSKKNAELVVWDEVCSIYDEIVGKITDVFSDNITPVYWDIREASIKYYVKEDQMEKIIIHPKCFICDNCNETCFKKDMKILQWEDKTFYFCESCYKDANEYLKNED
jgi:hypothetical protein